jgi:octaprenyl-diphosphate synthase
MSSPLDSALPQNNLSTFETIQQCVKDDMSSVNQVIQNSLHSEVPLVNQIGDYIINSGGKRMRPTLVLLAGGLFGNAQANHHKIAAVVEFIHTATLLHDDVVDESSQRRGKSTANAVFGNAASVLVGDFVYSRAFQMMVSVENMRVMEVLSNTTNTIAEGEVLQLLNVHNANIADDAYMQVIHYKTAKLFEAATQLGAILSHATADEEAALAQYGMHIGTAFQLIDDVLDLSGDANDIGKNLGDDLSEGKPTLPLLYAMRNGTENEAAAIKEAIEKGGLSQIDTVMSAVKRTGALDYVKTLADNEAKLACECIARFPNNAYKEALINLAHFSVQRNF